MRVLGIETSCDETGVAIYDESDGIIVNCLYSQKKIHSRYGGVVPELASRAHSRKIVSLIQRVTLESKCTGDKKIDAVAYTAGPGLVGSLMIGATIGHALAYAWKVPVVKVHHIEGHIFTPMLEGSVLEFPFLALVVSGGHTQLIFVYGVGQYKILGESLDDAVGEAFDKIAQLLGFNYPGGALLSEMARTGVVGRYIFPRPMMNHPSLDFSFSGLKTYVANVISRSANDDQTRADIARAFEDAIVETLSIKCQRALDRMHCNLLLLAGGVSANYYLRVYLTDLMEKRGGKIIFSSQELCTDNGAMIAYVGMLHFRLGLISTDLSVLVMPRWSIEDSIKLLV